MSCLPDPAKDFDTYRERVAPLAPGSSGGSGDAATFDSAPPTEASQGFYYGACLSQLAFGRVDRVFNFLAETSFTPDAAGGKLTLKLTSLKLSFEPPAPPLGLPPKTVSKAGTSGPVQGNADPAAIDAAGRYSIELGRVTVPADANPITGRDVVIEATKLVGRFSKERFCARLNGNVTQPVTLTLDPPQNVCQFVLVKDGDATPIFTDQSSFAPETCPE